MNKAKFYYKAENIEKLRPRTAEEVRSILEPLVSKEKWNTKDFTWLSNMMLEDIGPQPYNIVELVPITTAQYDWYTYHLLMNYEVVAIRNHLMGEKNGIVNCICVYAEDRPDALLINTAGYEYARYCAKIPLAEVMQ